jgi:hypothetical protein
VAALTPVADPNLVAYLRVHSNGERFDLATTGGSPASPYISNYGLRVLPMGGFAGTMPYPSAAQLAAMVAAGNVRYVLAGGYAYSSPSSLERDAWLVQNCRYIGSAAVNGRISPFTPRLYDCAP